MGKKKELIKDLESQVEMYENLCDEQSKKIRVQDEALNILANKFKSDMARVKRLVELVEFSINNLKDKNILSWGNIEGTAGNEIDKLVRIMNQLLDQLKYP